MAEPVTRTRRGTDTRRFFNDLSLTAGRHKTPARLPGASEFLCGASRSSWQLARRASKVGPESKIEIIRRHFFFFFAPKTIRSPRVIATSDFCSQCHNLKLGRVKLTRWKPPVSVTASARCRRFQWCHKVGEIFNKDTGRTR